VDSHLEILGKLEEGSLDIWQELLASALGSLPLVFIHVFAYLSSSYPVITTVGPLYLSMSYFSLKGDISILA
jgi:hypothetical protein